MTLHSIQAYKAHGVSRSHMHDMLQTRFSLPQLIRPLFSVYLLRYWSKEYFLQITELQSVRKDAILLDGIFYLIQYHRCTRGDLLQLHSKSQVSLSFRSAPAEFNLPAYVLVSINHDHKS